MLVYLDIKLMRLGLFHWLGSCSPFNYVNFNNVSNCLLWIFDNVVFKLARALELHVLHRSTCEDLICSSIQIP